MAISTVRILDTIEWAKKLNFGRRSVIGNFMEPALTSANLVMQTIIGPPFEWRWNKAEYDFVCVDPAARWAAGHTYTVDDKIIDSNGNKQTVVTGGVSGGTQPTWALPSSNVLTTNDGAVVWEVDYVSDYKIAAPTFWFIDDANVQEITPAKKWYEMENKNTLGLDSNPGRPRFISPHVQDNAGNVTFRLLPVPDKPYPVNIHAQSAPPQITDINQTWSPLPDYFQYIYSWGFLAMMYMFADDPRFAIANQKFVAHLIGAAEGLTEAERNVFLNNWNALSSGDLMKQQQGIQARGV